MVPDEGDPAPTQGGGVKKASASDDAFAATMAPTQLPAGTLVGRPAATDMESEATIAAPVTPRPPVADGTPDTALPTVSDAHYRGDEEIARGGMGKIVAAQDVRLGRPVALKQLIEPAGDALGRFEREALITARLQHPGIVPVYEAGRFPSGEPFFAMKLVKGEPLDRVIARARTFAERIALLPRVAAATDAIAYAHAERIVHRDLKPGNVLIGEFGETVVIDWGLAKDLDAETEASGVRTVVVKKPTAPREAVSTASSTLTVAGAVMGTPAYMAPEQARGETVDQRADVFALGAMLYHTLAGVPPYNARTATDVIAAAALGKVVPLREREDAVPPDLVAIVERAMASDPAKRYQNAGELATELKRFLTGQLVSSHHYTALQKLRRFVRKHRGAVTIGAIAVVTLAVGGTLAVRRIVQERDAADVQRGLADARREAAEHLIDRMLTDVKDRLVGIGRLDLLANLGGQIRGYYDNLASSPGGLPDDDLGRMASAIELIGFAERDSGQADQAFATWTGMRRKLADNVGTDASPATFAKRRAIAHLDFAIGTIHQQRKKADVALEAYGKARDEYAALTGEQPDDRETLLGAAETHDRIGDLLRNDGKLDPAFAAYTAGKVARDRAKLHPGPRPSDDLLALSTSHLKLGSIYQARGDTATALDEYKRALRLRETTLETQSDNVDLQEKVLDVQGTLAELERQIGDNKSAVEIYQAELPTMEALLGRDPNNTTWRRARGNLLADLGFALLDSGDFKRGLETLGHAIESQVDLTARDPKNYAWQIDLSRSYTRAGDGYLYVGDIDEGVAKYTLALDIRKKLVEHDPRSAPYRRSVAWSHHKLGNAYAFKGDAARATDEYELALALRATLAAEAPNQSAFKNELASTEITLGKLLAPRDTKRAGELVDAGLERARAIAAGDPINHEWKETVVQGLLAKATVDAARKDVTARKAALVEALAIATATAAKASQNAQWPGFLAEIHAGLAETDPSDAATHWRAVRDALEPLAAAGHLAATRKGLLERARAAR